MMKQIWVDKYRPKSFEEYVWTDENRRSKFEGYVKEQSIPHLLLTGGPGTGKTSIAMLLLEELGINEGDILKINASMENGIETIRTKVQNFSGMIGFGGVRVVVLDEADWLTLNAQGSLRNLIEENSDTTRFILTANYQHKIMEALKSRCHHYQFEKINLTDFTIRAATILEEEGVKYEPELLEYYINATYPDLRNCINTLEQNTLDGVLIRSVDEVKGGAGDFLNPALTLIRTGNITEARRLIIENADPTQYEDIYRYLYRNLEVWGDESRQKQALLIIANGLRDHAIVGDAEINLAATLVRLEIM